MIAAIETRRSIRKYRDTPVSKEIILEVLRAGGLAPSSKNRQPWKFIVVTGQSKAEMLQAARTGLLREQNRQALLPNSKQHRSGAAHTFQIMEQAPVCILIVNPLGLSLHQALTPEERIYEICNAQSIGAAIENMTLAATELGLGSLWICDLFFAYSELCEWLQPEGELFAALTLGYAEEAPAPRPRKSLSQTVAWRD